MKLRILLFILFVRSQVFGTATCTNCGDDCVGDWTTWSSCTEQCGGGTSIRTYNVKKPAIGNGKPCPCADGQTDIRSCNTQACPRDCAGSWSAWSGCSVLCGGGVATRTFHISHPAVGTGAACTCTEGQVDTQTCNTQICSVDCVGSWGPWGGCSKTCGGGVTTRSFKITSPAVGSGVACPFENGRTDSLPCNTQVCPVDCVGAWSAWSACSKTCGGGQSTRKFTVSSPAVGSGSHCAATNGQTEVSPCNSQLCAVNCVGAWSAWSACSVTCGGGSTSRTFVVTVPAVGSGTACPFAANQRDVAACNAHLCPVNCVGAWSAWSDCSVDCGSGTSSRTFYITTPAVASGTACVATHGQVASQTCNTQPCPVDCVGGWSSWSGCSVPCGGGVSTRSFTITTPCVGVGSPCVANNGQKETQQCNTAVCPIDCVGSWSAWSACSVGCGGGTKGRVFTITKPAVGGGAACSATNNQVQSEACNTAVCAVNCVGVWSAWSDCSVQCGGGSSIRVFSIVTPATGAGQPCSANHNQTQAVACNTQRCVTTTPTENCVGYWSAWSACTQQCGGGSRVRTFSIVQAAVNGGLPCEATDGQYCLEKCNIQPCPQDCCGEWSAWCGCSKPCGGGVSTRSFTVTLPALYGGKACANTQGQIDTKPCNTGMCPVDCVGGWTPWSGCSVQCGGGVTTRVFNITTPAVGGGAQCPCTAGQTESLTCNTAPCPVDCVGAWSAWGSCSAPCGGGTSTRKFRITVAACGTGAQCPHRECEKETRICNTDLCPVDCVGHWTNWTECSAECGGGVSTRSFVVTTPKVGTGAACCAADAQVDTQACNTHVCPVNCVGGWSGWSECSAECGGGLSTRFFNITTPVLGTGAPCLGADGQEETCSCNTQICARDCVGAWSSWTECSVPCGGGASSRTYHIISPAVGGGCACPIEDLKTECMPCNAIACPPDVGTGPGPVSSSSSLVTATGNTGSTGSTSSTGSEPCTPAWSYECASEDSDNVSGVSQCCYKRKCHHHTGGEKPKCGWRPSLTHNADVEDGVNDNCDWSWYCPPGTNTPPSCAWRWLCIGSADHTSVSGHCSFDFYCGTPSIGTGNPATDDSSTGNPDTVDTDSSTGNPTTGTDTDTGIGAPVNLNDASARSLSLIVILAIVAVGLVF